MKIGIKKGLVLLLTALVVLVVGGFIILFLCYSAWYCKPREGAPESVKYHTASDLQKITKIEFPEIELVDSTFYDDGLDYDVTEMFVIKETDGRSKLLNAIKEGEYWEQTQDGYEFYISRKMTTEGSNEFVCHKDLDVGYLGIMIPFSNDTIIVRYGWPFRD